MHEAAVSIKGPFSKGFDSKRSAFFFLVQSFDRKFQSGYWHENFLGKLLK